VKIIYSLILIRFRKNLAKDDYTAITLVVLVYLFVAYFAYFNFDNIGNFFYLLFLDNVLYHQRRKDLGLLKVNKRHRQIVFSEYILYSFPFFIVLFLKGKVINVLIVLLIYGGMILSPKLQLNPLKYPFKLFDPYWHITFRKYKVIFWLPLIVIVSYMGIRHNNENIQFFILGTVTIICCLPSFEREKIIEINYTSYNHNKYLYLQLKNTLINTLYVIIPISLIVYLTIFDISIILFALFAVFIPLINVLLKYCFFYSPIKQQLGFVFGIMIFGIIVVTIPYLYREALKNIKTIKNAEY